MGVAFSRRATQSVMAARTGHRLLWPKDLLTEAELERMRELAAIMQDQGVLERDLHLC